MARKKSDPKQYTKPELRDRIKAQVTAGNEGGKAGQWSARKAQMVAHAYEAEGGGYKHEKSGAQASLTEWGEEHWRTRDGGKAVRTDATARYLPEKAWEELPPGEKAATEKKKREGSRAGKQFVANTATASAARKRTDVGSGRVAKKAVGKKAVSGKKTAARVKG